MKKIYLILLAFVSLFAVSCSKSDSATQLYFGKPVYAMLADTPLTIELKSSSAVSSDVSVPVNFGGTAVKDDEYTISSSNFEFTKGSSSATITITPKNNLTSGKEIALSLGAMPAGFSLGKTPTSIVTLDKKEKIIYSFSVDKADLLDRYTITADLKGETSGNNFTSTTDIIIPLAVDAKSTAVLGTDYEIIGGTALALVVKAGTNKGTLTIQAKSLKVGEEKTLILGVDASKAGARYIVVNIPNRNISVKGLLKLSQLVGTWKFVEITELAQIKEWAAEEGDDPEIIPFHNTNYTLSFAQDGDAYKLIPGSTKGDLSALLRECIIAYTAPKNTILKSKILGTYCTEEPFMWTRTNIQLTYFSLSKGNRAFSSSKVKEGTSVVAMRLLPNGNLEIHLRDYDQPPFMPNWWNASRFDADMFGFCYVFKKE